MPIKHQLLREAEEKEALATTFTRYAKMLANVFDGIPSQQNGSESYWQGPAAERYRGHAVQLRSHMGDLENGCLATADNLRRRAKQLREEAAQSPDPV
ncbi:WXG100 family type VII secretion target [Nonomuraea sp. KM90]|uniref:WXG100 family type VII secretion target n=1 Tax=Nonomuraea sp. KM90 TaxID=3457428 RepID=UPI003FCEBF8F